jgi:carboxymethylenebutenolidase
MRISRDSVGLTVEGSLMRLYVAQPVTSGCWPGIVFFSDIYQLGAPMTRLVDRLAGYGYVVAAPEIFHRREPIGTTIEPDALGRLRGNHNARNTPIAAYDADTVATLAWLGAQPLVDARRLGALGFCIGGHLAFRAAFRADVRASVCVYPTGLQDGTLGLTPADSIQRAGEIKGALLTIFGSLDPHVPADARAGILSTLEALPDLCHRTLLYEANHTFLRDDGDRWDPQLADQAWGEVISFLDQELVGSLGC